MFTLTLHLGGAVDSSPTPDEVQLCGLRASTYANMSFFVRVSSFSLFEVNEF